MADQNRKLPKGQNRIDYIVYHNPEGVSKLLHDYGYDPPKLSEDLAKATKELVKIRGRKVIEALLEQHPDKGSILKLDTAKRLSYCRICNTTNYDAKTDSCKTCGHFKYKDLEDEDAFFNPFKDKEKSTLDRYYQELVERANQNPEDKNLSKEVQLLWNARRQRKANEKSPVDQTKMDSKLRPVTSHEVLVMSVIFIAGLLVGHGLKFNRNHAK